MYNFYLLFSICFITFGNVTSYANTSLEKNNIYTNSKIYSEADAHTSNLKLSSKVKSIAQDELATVYIVRNNGFAASAAACYVFHNAKFKGKIKNKDIIKLELPAGKHNISAGSSALGVETLYTHLLEIEQGKTYYLSANLSKARVLEDASVDQKTLDKSLKKIKKAKEFVVPDSNDIIEYEDKFANVLYYSITHKENLVLSNGRKIDPDNTSFLQTPEKITGYDEDIHITPSIATPQNEVKSNKQPHTELPSDKITAYKLAQKELITTLEQTEGLNDNIKWEILKSSNTHLKANFSLTDTEFDDPYAGELESVDRLVLSDEEKFLKFKTMQESANLDSEEIDHQATGIASIIAEKNGFVLNNPEPSSKPSGPSIESDASDIASIADDSGVSLNRRDAMYKEILQMKQKNGFTTVNNSVSTSISEENYNSDARVKDNSGSLEETGLKYRRSSLYTLMINDKNREHYQRIRNSFGNIELSEKFNDHNIGPYLIPGIEGEDQTQNINTFLAQNNVAKELVAKWFNRGADGTFNMDLVAERGSYDASELDVMIAKESKRGNALLADAGEELIKNTFIVVYDYKYSNKEESAKKTGGWLNAISTVASYAGLDVVSNVADVANIAQTTMGKGYFVKTTAYLYKLKWDDAIAAQFYNDMWIDKANYDQAKKEAFDNTDIFQLEFVGTQVARKNLQSSIFSAKSNEDLIGIATIRAADKSISKLQREYEQFRVKTPLLSGDPITAAIGIKEGLEKGDKFEVLEQTINKEGLTEYKRVGVIKVDHRQIWDNSYLAEEDETANRSGYTVFKGSKNKYFPGMLIRQIK